MTAADLMIIRDYLKEHLRIINIDNHVGYREGTLQNLINKITKELTKVNITIDRY